MATIRIMSGGAPKEIFLQLTPQFEGQSGHKVDYVFAVMSALRDRLAAGEKADVLVMPTNILDGYQKDKIVRAEGRAVLRSECMGGDDTDHLCRIGVGHRVAA